MQTNLSICPTPTHCRNIANIAPFAATRGCAQPKHGLAGATGQSLRLPRGRPVLDFLAGAAFLVIWGALWSLLLFAYQSPLENAEDREAQTQVIGDSASLGDPPPSCSTGMIALNGRCVLGEEIEVRPPAGWSGR